MHSNIFLSQKVKQRTISPQRAKNIKFIDIFNQQVSWLTNGLFTITILNYRSKFQRIILTFQLPRIE